MPSDGKSSHCLWQGELIKLPALIFWWHTTLSILFKFTQNESCLCDSIIKKFYLVKNTKYFLFFFPPVTREIFTTIQINFCMVLLTKTSALLIKQSVIFQGINQHSYTWNYMNAWWRYSRFKKHCIRVNQDIDSSSILICKIWLSACQFLVS